MNKIGKENLIIINGSEYVHCPVCGTVTAVYDICDICQWQNTGETNIDGGPNEMTLAEANEASTKGIPIIEQTIVVRKERLMELKEFNNKVVRITDIDGQIFKGVALYEDKDVYDEELDGLSVNSGTRWIKLFENEIKEIKITDKINQSKKP